MFSNGLALAALLPLALLANGIKYPDEDGKYWIAGDGLEAAFVPYRAAITNLLIDDQYGVSRDIVAGFDKASSYSTDKAHPHYSSIVGRYTNRVRNSTFEMDSKKYHITPNDHPTKEAPEGADTLHRGPDGWDYQNFTVVSHTDSSITFSIVDPNGKEGFPGESEPRRIGDRENNKALKNNCGFNCTGYDVCYIVSRDQLGQYDWRTEGPVASFASSWSGIQVDIYSDQDAFLFYSCAQQKGDMPLKKTQGLKHIPGASRVIPKHGCAVMMLHDYIDGINHPEWLRDRKQIFEPGGDPFVLQARHSFSLIGKSS
ncbi:hypothetical protein H9Q69_013910 [Fusarium xylarioides]|nr:hypothetical protein H9Q69_013910 [Fusarium xylarioides]